MDRLEYGLIPEKYGPVRRAILKQSYYVVYFVEEESRVVLLAVLDGRRDPREIRRIVRVRRGRRDR